MLDTAKKLKVLVVYIAVTHGPITANYCSRFVGSWIVNPPGVDCDLVVSCNGGPLAIETAMLFLPLQAKFYPRSNDPGWDISAFLDIVRAFECDMICCLGESVYFHRPNWLKRVVDTWTRFGPGMYGFFSSHAGNAHLNTTAFCVDPKYLKGYPHVSTHAQRYEFEHGPTALWRRVHSFGAPVMLVTWDGAWKPGQWRQGKNILWRGDQTNCMVWANHVDRYWAAAPLTKAKWANRSDQPFR